MFLRAFFTLMCLSQILILPEASAWGKRGHQIVGETAAQVVSSEPNASFMKERSYDFGYYNNVPDVVWKRPATYEDESHNHFMDLEIFDREFAKQNLKAPEQYALNRADFQKKFPDLNKKAGRAFWRIQEFETTLQKITEQLKSGKEKEAHRKLQEQWLVLAGTMGHYVADLCQPLHVSENYDGQLTDQKGIHHIYEEEYVDELYPQLAVDVLKAAQKEWPKFKKDHEKMPILELLTKETSEAHKQLKDLLAMDKKMNRKDTKKNAEKYRPMITKNLVQGSLVLAEIYRRNLGWNFDGEKFYFFGSDPAHFSSGPVPIK